MKPKLFAAAIAAIFIHSCGEPGAPISKYVDTTTYHPTTVSESGYVNPMDKEGDIYNNRNDLLRKLKVIDPSADFSDSAYQSSDQTDDSFDGPDKYGCDIQLTGSKKHVKEVNYTFRESAIPNDKVIGARVITKISKLLAKQKGEEFAVLYLAAINMEPEKSFKDSTVIDDKKLIIEYQADSQIDLIIKHQ